MSDDATEPPRTVLTTSTSYDDDYASFVAWIESQFHYKTLDLYIRHDELSLSPSTNQISVMLYYCQQIIYSLSKLQYTQWYTPFLSQFEMTYEYWTEMRDELMSATVDTSQLLDIYEDVSTALRELCESIFVSIGANLTHDEVMGNSHIERMTANVATFEALTVESDKLLYGEPLFYDFSLFEPIASMVQYYNDSRITAA